MSELANHYSYAIAALTLLAALAPWVLRRRSWRALAAFTLAATAAVGVGLAMRPGDPSVASVAAFDRLVGAGAPALVEFYSNY